MALENWRNVEGSPRVSRTTSLWAVAAPLLASVLLARFYYGVELGVAGVVTDFLLLGGLFQCLRPAARNAATAWTAGALVVVLLHLSHVLKTAYMGAPVIVGDVAAIPALFDILHGWRKWVAIAIAIMLGVAAVWSIWPRRGGWKYLVLSAGYAAFMLVGALAFARSMPGPAADPSSMLQKHGGVLTLASSFAGTTWSGSAPAAPDVAAAVGPVVGTWTDASPASPSRNVHLVLLETLWDPRELSAYSFSADPWDPRFRALWQEGGASSVLVPGFGGATANAEFEALCGMPSSGAAVLFENVVRNAMPCLPRVLREAGYLTMASHPYYADFWNRDEAYQLIGFEKYHPAAAFELDDMDGTFLTDSSMFAQAGERLQDQGRPIFNYLVSLASHYPYYRDRSERPDIVSVQPRAQVLENYSNSTRYATKAFMDYLDKVLSDDPEALVVAFGDHAPVLGVNPDPYEESGLSKQDPASLPVLAQTPLIVVDGRRGAVGVGAIPLRSLPALVLELIGERAPRLPISSVEASGLEGADSHVYLGRMMVRVMGQWKACALGENAAECQEAKKLHQRLLVLREDLARGKQFALTRLGAGQLAQKTAMTVVRDHPSCALPVVAWGPRSAMQGKGFNVQPSGRSAMWMKLSDTGRGRPLLRIGIDQTRITINGHTASASFAAPVFVHFPDTYPVEVVCPDGTRSTIGHMVVK